MEHRLVVHTWSGCTSVTWNAMRSRVPSHTPPRGAPQAASFIKPSDTQQGTDSVRLLSTDHSGAEHVRPEMAFPRPLRDRHSRHSLSAVRQIGKGCLARSRRGKDRSSMDEEMPGGFVCEWTSTIDLITCSYHMLWISGSCARSVQCVNRVMARLCAFPTFNGRCRDQSGGPADK